MSALSYLLPIVPVLFIVVSIWLLISYILYRVLCGIDKKQEELSTVFEQKKKDWKIEKADIRMRVSALANENHRLQRMMQYELDRVKAHIGIHSPVRENTPLQMDNIVNVSQKTEDEVLEKFSTQNLSEGGSTGVE